ncbi:MAG TPA: adenylate/guanylate cyclase domain-containing protein [Candidatus Binataceae bacterium]|nr:adenylate/guanylate cyclase domain-containing protein [Candidatus Binataceae bacterium]
MRCSSCDTDNPAGMKFCGNCAAPLQNRCAQCGFDNPPNFKFCGQCATPLGAAASQAPNTQSAKSGPAVRITAEASAASAPDGERKTVTALFADIKGSMDLMEELDPEEAREIVDPALNLMIDAVHRYDGYIVQSTGDGIFALFGAPVAHEDHAARALYAALRLQIEMRKYSARLREKGHPPIETRVGVNTGEVVVRTIRTGDEHVEYTPIGHSTSLASRMQTLAPTGSIVVAEQTQKLCAGYFEFRALGPARVKGVSEPVNIYEVTGLGPLRTRLQISAERGLSKFVGRDAEMKQLRRALDLSCAGHGQIVAAVAEAGVGKSRLFHEFKLTAGVDCAVLETFSVSHGRASAYLPIVEMLREYFRIANSDDERTRREKITGKVLALDRALEDTLPYLFSLLGVDAGAMLEGIDPAVQRRRTRDAVKSIILRESLNQPLILIVEDLHWIDSETQGLLDAMADSVGPTRILMMVNYRPEYRHQWGNKTCYTQLRLDPLGPEMASEMLAALLGEARELDPLKRMIISRTEGNPFFMEEMVRVLFDEGILEHGDSGGVTLRREAATIQVPATVQGILASRIDRLGAAEKDLLQTLSVIGKEFPLGLIRSVTGASDETLVPLLQNLQLGEFIYEQPSFPESEYTFKHALTQDVAYQSVLVERRRQIHERAADAIENIFSAKLEDHLGELAHHYSHSSNPIKAIQYCQSAGKQAFMLSAYDDAIRYTRDGLRLVGTLAQSHERDKRELELLVQLGPMLVSTQGFSSAELPVILRRAELICRHLGEVPEIFPVMFSLWSFYFSSGRLGEARDMGNKLLSLSEHADKKVARAGAHAALGSTLTWLGEFRAARDHLDKAIAIYDTDLAQYLPSPQTSVIPSRCNISWSLFVLGYPDQGLARMEEASKLARDFGRPFSIAFTLLYSLSLWHLRRDTNPAMAATCNALIELAREKEFPYWLATGTTIMGRIIADEGDFERALKVLEQGRKDLAASGGELVYSYSNVMLAEIYLAMKRPDEGLAVIDEAIERCEKYNHRLNEAEIFRLQGELLSLRSDSADAAAKSLRHAIEVAQRQEALSFELRAALSLARLMIASGKRVEARELVAPLYARFSEGFDTVDLVEASRMLGELR